MLLLTLDKKDNYPGLLNMLGGMSPAGAVPGVSTAPTLFPLLQKNYRDESCVCV